MPRVHTTKKAQKDYKEQGIKKGETFHYWKFRYGGIIRSKVYPKQSQLTQSTFLSSYYSLTESVGAFTAETIEGDISSMIESVGELISMCQDSLENMPDHLRDTSSSGELLTERIEAMESWQSDLEAIDLSHLEEEGEGDDDKENDLPDVNEKKESIFLEIMDEIGNCEPGL